MRFSSFILFLLEVENEFNGLDNNVEVCNMIVVVVGDSRDFQSGMLILMNVHGHVPSSSLFCRLEETKMMFSNPSSWQKP